MAASPRAKDQGTGQKRMPDEPNCHLVEEAKSKLVSQVNTNKSAAGLAIVVGNTHPAGVEIDIERMEKAFKKLNFVVIAYQDPSVEFLVALLHVAAKYQYPEEFFRFIAVYFAGHGGSDDGHAFIYPAKNSTSRLFVEEGIMREFYPENTPSLSNRTRLFFFDSCLKDDTIKGLGDGSAQFEECSDALLPARGNILVAYATSLTFGSRGNKREGGYWTRHLHHNLVNLDLSLSTVLDITWEETVVETGKKNKGDLHKTQGPHYISCLGLVYLKHPNWSREYALEHSKSVAGVTANVNGAPANVEGPNAVKHLQETAVVTNGRQEMRALGSSGQVADNTGTDQEDKDALRWRRRDSGDSGSDDGNCERSVLPVQHPGDYFDGPLTSSGEPDSRIPPSLCTKPLASDVEDKIAPIASLVDPDSRAARLLRAKPFARDVVDKIAKHGLMWKLIGKALGLESHFLDDVETNRLAPRASLESVIDKWMANSEATWEQLIQAMLDKDELHCCAKCLAKFLKSDPCFDKYEKQAPN